MSKIGPFGRNQPRIEVVKETLVQVIITYNDGARRLDPISWVRLPAYKIIVEAVYLYRTIGMLEPINASLEKIVGAAPRRSHDSATSTIGITSYDITPIGENGIKLLKLKKIHDLSLEGMDLPKLGEKRLELIVINTPKKR